MLAPRRSVTRSRMSTAGTIDIAISGLTPSGCPQRRVRGGQRHHAAAQAAGRKLIVSALQRKLIVTLALRRADSAGRPAREASAARVRTRRRSAMSDGRRPCKVSFATHGWSQLERNLESDHLRHPRNPRSNALAFASFAASCASGLNSALKRNAERSGCAAERTAHLGVHRRFAQARPDGRSTSKPALGGL